ncbi:BatD family protein [Gracilinema caldarium]|uniref:SH3 domain-containing protein n=1 Tax=Gracilinema caldarium (strain ATCC 51460 / DSM 7334 / H1) TaxID=744872 RepID=F8F3W7_GRAC1|nr:BatD family protein [Gracilinema caldarium]AEJ20486.1 hypothetical protein Spica_2376 [Gracilinema caldarium DSM 7334]
MEKSTIEKFRRKFHRLLSYGFLVVLVCSPIGSIYAEQGLHEPAQVLVEIEGSVLNLGQSWKLTLIINYPEPDQVRIKLPPIPEHLVLDRIRTGVRLISQKPWTTVEYTFIAKTAGSLVLGPFEIQIPGNLLRTSPQALSIQNQNELTTTILPRLFWSSSLPVSTFDSTPVGAPLVFELHLGSSHSEIPAKITALSVNLVQNALVESLPVSDSEREQGVLYRIRFTPLVQGPLALPEATLHLEKEILYSEPRTIMVTDAQKKSNVVSTSQAARSQQPPKKKQIHSDKTKAVLFSEYKPDLPWLVLWPLIAGSVQSVLLNCEELWNAGTYAQALVLLRKVERDSLMGPLYRNVRKDAEALVGITSSPDEWWIPQRLLYCLAILCIGFAVITGVKKLIKRSIVLIAFTAIILVYSSFGQTLLIPHLRGGLIGVIRDREVLAYSIPDTSGSMNTHFSEGEGVMIQEETDTWVFVTAFDHRSGWILRSSIFTY